MVLGLSIECTSLNQSNTQKMTNKSIRMYNASPDVISGFKSDYDVGCYEGSFDFHNVVCEEPWGDYANREGFGVMKFYETTPGTGSWSGIPGTKKGAPVIKQRFRKFSGIWTNNYFETGKMEYVSGDIFVGKFDSIGLMLEGTMSYSNGDKFCGTFAHGLYPKNGEMKYANGTKYTGDFRFSEMCKIYRSKNYHI